MKHFGIFESVEDAQDALNAGRLENDYVALVDGDLDYNSLAPIPLGTWENQTGLYVFTFNDYYSPEAWSNGIKIGTLDNVYYDGEPMVFDVIMRYDYTDSGDTFFISYVNEEEGVGFEHSFVFNGSADFWGCTELLTSTEDPLDVVVFQTHDTELQFALHSGSNTPLSMTTIDPYNAGE